MLKQIANGLALVLVSPAAFTCWLEGAVSNNAEGIFTFWTHIFAILPGLPGAYLRRAFYRMTLEDCSLESFIGFGALFAHRRACVAEKVYVGPYAVIGSVRLGAGALVGTRANVLSGSRQHVLDAHGRWQPADAPPLMDVEIGEHVWVGEAATIMASVGAGSVVAAGAVVSAPVAEGIVVAGNPARFVRRLRDES